MPAPPPPLTQTDIQGEPLLISCVESMFMYYIHTYKNHENPDCTNSFE